MYESNGRIIFCIPYHIFLKRFTLISCAVGRKFVLNYIEIPRLIIAPKNENRTETNLKSQKKKTRILALRSLRTYTTEPQESVPVVRDLITEVRLD